MKVRVKFLSIREESEESVRFETASGDVAIPKCDFKYGKRNSIIMDRFEAEKYGISWSPLFHMPPYIKAEFGQNAIYELRCETDGGG